MTVTIIQTGVGQKSSHRPDSLECVLTSYAITRLSFEEVNSLRKQPEALAGSLSYSVLRHVDEQSLAALAATAAATRDLEGPPQDFGRWGIVTSSRYLGRASFIQTLCKYGKEGPWNVSIQVVPNRSLHSPASTLGLAIGCHGPCVGVGGGKDGETDAWISALTLLQQHKLAGMWMIFCGWEPEEQVNLEGAAINGAHCTALALALQPADTESCLARLRIAFDPSAPSVIEVPGKQTMISQFENYIAQKSQHEPLTINLGGCLKTELEWVPSRMATIPISQQHSLTLPKKAA